MLTIRSFRNEDPPSILEIWQKNRYRPERTHFFPLTMGQMEAVVLATPFFDYQLFQLAFDGPKAVAFAHACFGPNEDGSNLSKTIGHICMVAVAPDYPDPVGAAKGVIAACEQRLVEKGVREIYGGSPRPSAPFYTGLYSGSEPIAIMDSDPFVIEAFKTLDFPVFQKTVRFQLELANYSPPITPNTVGWKHRVNLDESDRPESKNWWEACTLAHFDWLETTAKLLQGKRPVARVRIRVADRSSETQQRLYDKNWDASLMDVRVHPDFHRQGLAAYTLGETLRLLVMQNRAASIEAHVAEDNATVYPLLRSLRWHEVETGTSFRKIIF